MIESGLLDDCLMIFSFQNGIENSMDPLMGLLQDMCKPSRRLSDSGNQEDGKIYDLFKRKI